MLAENGHSNEETKSFRKSFTEGPGRGTPAGNTGTERSASPAPDKWHNDIHYQTHCYQTTKPCALQPNHLGHDAGSCRLYWPLREQRSPAMPPRETFSIIPAEPGTLVI